MTITFTEKELEWIDKKPFDWKIKKECPKNLEKDIIRKLNILNEKIYDYEKGFK